MSRGREFLLALGAIVIAAWLVAPRSEGIVTDGPPSIYETGPSGAQAVRDLAERYDVGVRPFRHRMIGLPRLVGAMTDGAVLVIESGRLSPMELDSLRRTVELATVILAGNGSGPLMGCYGYRRESYQDSTAIHRPLSSARAPLVRYRLAATAETVVVDSSRSSDFGKFTCHVAAGLTADTLLRDDEGQPIAVRVVGEGIAGSVLLVADAELFRNRTLRDTWAAEFVIAEVITPHRQLLVDEYHHGHDDRGSMMKPLLAWSRQSPWGWLIWQAAAVGLLALGFGAIRVTG